WHDREGARERESVRATGRGKGTTSPPHHLTAPTPNTQHPTPRFVSFDWLNETRSAPDPPARLPAEDGLRDPALRAALLHDLTGLAATMQPAYLDLAPDVNLLQRADPAEF